MDFTFLKSVRFWKLGAAVAVEFLASQGIVDANLAHAIAAWLTGSVVVRTVDRAGEYVGGRK